MTVAVVLMAYGTPSSPAQILPYYTDIRRGRPPSDDQLAELTSRYEAIGGLSPLAERTEAQRVALQAELDQLEPGAFDVLLGLKHAEPSIEDAVADVARSGCSQIIGLVLAPHHSGASIGQYLGRLRAAAARHDIPVNAVESWATEPAFLDFIEAEIRRLLATMPAATKVVFTAHSLPQRVIDAGDDYIAEVRSTAAAVAERLALPAWSGWAVAWQSAGRTAEPWLGPDILQVIDDLATSEGATGVIVSAVGFVADHLEVLYDLDIEAAQRARARRLAFARTACVNDDQRVMAALASRITQLRDDREDPR